MSDCIHLHLSRLADTIYVNFPSYKAGFRYYKCDACGVTLKAIETHAHPVEVSEGKECGC